MRVIPKIMKTKFVGLLRGLLHRFDENEVNVVELPRPITTAPVENPPVVAEQPQPIFTPTPQLAVPEDQTAADDLELPLQTVLAALPMDLRAKVMQNPPAGATMVMAIEKVLAQLANGSVKISFGELRLAAPSLFANSGGESDSRPVTLPLNEVLLRLKPALLSRSPNQRKIDVADDVAGPFDGRGQGIRFSTAPLKAAPAAAPAPAPAPRTKAPVQWPTAPPNPIAPVAPAAPVTPIAPITPITPIAPITPMAPVAPRPAFASRSTTPVTPIRPVTPTAPVTPAAPLPPAAGIPPTAINPFQRNGTPRLGSIAPISPITPAAHPTVPAAHPTALPEHAQSTISAPLAALSEEWPEVLRQEIAQTNLANSQVALPVHLVEPALKRGRVIFSWRYVRSWIRPVPPGVSLNDGIELELPLKVIAPLFFGQQKNVSRYQRKISLTQEIPDLFFGFPQSQAPEPTEPQPEAITPQPELAEPELAGPEPEPEKIHYTPKPVELKPSDSNYYNKPSETNFYIWGDQGEVPKGEDEEIRRPVAATPPTDFTSRRAMPKDIVARATGLPGVSGALVALQDGLKVASRVPSDLNADTLAAFLPQIFDKLGQSTRELRMGALNNVNFTVGNVPWKIFRVNAVYFAAFGRAGEALPTAQLALLAAELDRKK